MWCTSLICLTIPSIFPIYLAEIISASIVWNIFSSKCQQQQKWTFTLAISLQVVSHAIIGIYGNLLEKWKYTLPSYGYFISLWFICSLLYSSLMVAFMLMMQLLIKWNQLYTVPATICSFIDKWLKVFDQWLELATILDYIEGIYIKILKNDKKLNQHMRFFFIK